MQTKVKAITLSDVLEDDWFLFDILYKEEDNPGPDSVIGTVKSASVYLADTHEQVARMGLALPKVDDVCDFNETNHYSIYTFCLF